jgi:7-cyano-7-deazaguanine synthase in queuosine biosynthesis
VKVLKDTILPLSGGLDSTYCMYDYLKKNPVKVLMVHHVKLKNYEGRWEHELKAVHAILNWFRENNMANFKYIESGFDYGDIRYVNHDVVTIGYVTGTILRNPRNNSIKTVISPTCLEESKGYGEPTSALTLRHKRKLDVIKTASNREDIKLSYPILKIGKGDIKRILPKELYSLCWYCRRPTFEGKVCGTCRTCRRVANDKVYSRDCKNNVKK